MMFLLADVFRLFKRILSGFSFFYIFLQKFILNTKQNLAANAAGLKKERNKIMANTVKVSREVKQHEGRKFMTAKGIAEMSGIAHGALTSRLYRMKQEHPDHVHYFADEVPAYYDEFAFRYIVKDIKKHPVYRINNQQKYEKFKQLYGEPKSQDAVKTTAAAMVKPAETVVRQPKMTADEVKSSKEKASKTNEATLLKIAKEQAAEIEKLKAELSSAKQALEAKDAECTKLKAEYSALQTKYVMSAELFAERVYKMAMSPKPDFSADDSDCGNIVTIKNS